MKCCYWPWYLSIQRAGAGGASAGADADADIGADAGADAASVNYTTLIILLLMLLPHEKTVRLWNRIWTEILPHKINKNTNKRRGNDDYLANSRWTPMTPPSPTPDDDKDLWSAPLTAVDTFTAFG